MMEVKSKDKMTEVGEIPVEWEVQSLSSVLDIRDGTHDSPNYVQRGVPFLTSKNLGKGKLKFKEVNYITEEDHKKFSERSLVENGDILFGMIGTVGNPVIVDLPYSISIKNVALVKFHKSNMNNKYVLEYLNSQNTLKQFKKESNGGVQKFIALGKIREIKITVPPLKEQKKIAEILSTVDEQIEQTDQLIEKTKELKKGLMQQLLTKGIGHTEFKQSELGDIPVEWEIATLGSIVDISSGLSPSKIQTLSKEGEYPFFKVNDLNFCVKYLDNAIYNFEDSISLQIKKDSIIFPKRGASIFTNKIAIVNKSGLMDTNLMALYVKDKKKVNFEFIYYYLLNRGLSEIADTSSVPQINNKHIEPLKISLPKFEEQQKITNILSSVDEELEGYEEEKAQYEELKKGLMQQLLTGKTRVKVD